MRGLAAEAVEEPDRLVEVVHDGRVPVQIPLEEVLVGESGIVDVAVVVVLGVFAPVGDAGFEDCVVIGNVFLVAVVPVDGAVAAIGVCDRHDGYDDLIADLLDEVGVFDGEAVGELHQHLGRAEFGGVETAGEGVDGLGVGDDFFRLVIGEAAGIGEAGEIFTVGVEVFDGVFRPDEDDDGVAAFFRLADVDNFDARRRGG